MTSADCNIREWHWIVGGDDSRAWSSALASYVTLWPPDRITRIASESELSDVLRPHGLRGPVIDAVDVKAECQRRIIALTGTTDIIGCMLKQSNANMRANELNDKRLNGETLTEAEAGDAASLRKLATAIKAIRAKSNDIEVMVPIPDDYADDYKWTP